MNQNSFSEFAWNIFNKSINDYHITDNVDANETNNYAQGSLEQILYSKNWIDTVQWHLEDIIRDENINPVKALEIKRRIDASNQKRTDLVEFIDGWFLNKYRNTCMGCGQAFYFGAESVPYGIGNTQRVSK